MFGILLKFILVTLFLCCFSLSWGAEKYNTDIRYLYVQPGQTLHNIVSRLYPQQKKRWAALRAQTVRLNPHAFIHADETRMKAGVKLRLPMPATVHRGAMHASHRKPVGTVTEVRGKVVAVDAEKQTRKLKKNTPVYLGDKIITGEDGYIQLHMIDKAILDLHCYSVIVIEDYALKIDSRRSILNLLRGSLRKVSGTIGRLKNDVYELKTPVANVGVRGTEYALRVFQSKGCGGRANADNGLYLEVIKGLVNVSNKAGKVLLAKGDTAYVALPDKKPLKRKIDTAILHPVVKNSEQPKKAAPPANSAEDKDTNFWWWLLGGAVILAVAL